MRDALDLPDATSAGQGRRSRLTPTLDGLAKNGAERRTAMNIYNANASTASSGDQMVVAGAGHAGLHVAPNCPGSPGAPARQRATA